MNAFIASLRKELSLLRRDWHALLLLFAMPVLFILIMSMALTRQMGEGEPLSGRLVVAADSEPARAFAQQLREHPQLSLRAGKDDQPLQGGGALYEVRLKADFERVLNRAPEGEAGVILRFAPELGERDQWLITAAVREAFARYSTRLTAQDLGYGEDYAEQELLRVDFVQTRAPDTPVRPNAVQQSVPAWLIFAMFFIAIPLSTTVVQERQQRTLMRLQTLGLSAWVFYGAKLLPYLGVNLLQLVTMLAVGLWLLPLLGAEGLSLTGVDPAALAVMGLCTSLAALSVASLIAALARSVEQATVASGAFNILCAALGGIMVPTFVMPPVMQSLAWLSPMAWSLEGFLTVLVRGGGLSDILIPAGLLTLSSALLWLVAGLWLKRDRRYE